MTSTMRKLTSVFTPALMLAVAFAGCNKDEPEAVDLGYGYFPRTVGTWIEYQVDSSWRDEELGLADTVSYRLKEKVVEAYIDPAGRTAYRIHRFILNADDQWVIRDVWTSIADGYYAEVTEENIRRLKMSFPVDNGRKWDLNIYNTEDELEVAFRNEGESWTGPTMVFPNTALGKNSVPANLVIRRDWEERYAEGVGMVSKYREETTSNPNSQGVWQAMGWRLDMVAVAYGTD